MSQDKLPEILGVEKVAQSRFFCVEAVHLKFSNGVTSTYERLAGGLGAVMVVPFDGTQFILSKEYCVGTENYELGFVKGKIDAGEDPVTSALRELSEEIGLGAKKITHLKTVNFAPGFMTLKMHIFLAEDLFPKKLLSGDEPEEIKTRRYTVEEALTLINDEHSPLVEARCVMGLIYALKKLNFINLC